MRLHLLVVAAVVTEASAGKGNCMSFADDDCDGCNAAKDGRCPGTWCDQPCMYFSRDLIPPGAASPGDTTRRCQPAKWWLDRVSQLQGLNPGIECFGDYPGCTSCSAAPSGHAWGEALVLVLTAGGVIYLVAGVAVGRQGGKGGVGVSAHVHHRQWAELAGLVGDGMAFVGRGGGRRRGGATAREGGAGAAPLLTARSASTKDQREEQRGTKGEKKKRREKKGKGVPAEQESASAAAAGRAAGGRWVHIATG